MTPNSVLYQVTGYEHKPGQRKKAVLRLGADGAGRKKLRDWDAVVGWVIQPKRDSHENPRITKHRRNIANALAFAGPTDVELETEQVIIGPAPADLS